MKKILSVISLAILFAGCSPYPPHEGHENWIHTEVTQCDPEDRPVRPGC